MFKKTLCLILIFALFMGYSFNFSNLVENYGSILTPINNAVNVVKGVAGIGGSKGEGNYVHLLNDHVYNYDKSRQISYKEVLKISLPKSNDIRGIDDVEIVAINPTLYEISYGSDLTYTCVRLTIKGKQDKTFVKGQTVEMDCIWAVPFVPIERELNNSKIFPTNYFSGLIGIGILPEKAYNVKTRIFNFYNSGMLIPIFDFNHLEYSTSSFFIKEYQGNKTNVLNFKMNESRATLQEVIELCVDVYQII